MAISVARFVAWFAVGAVAIWAGSVGVMASDNFRLQFWFSSRSTPSQQATRLSIAVGVLERRDSIARALRARPPANGLSVVIANSATARERASIDSTIRAFWQRAVGRSAAVPTVLVVTDDGVRQSFLDLQPTRLSFLLAPSQTNGRSCAMALSSADIGELGATPKSRVSVETLNLLLESSAELCVLHAKYGPPGEAIRQWLQSKSWIPAGSAVSVADRETASLAGPTVRRGSGAAQHRTPGALARDSRFSTGSQAWGLGFTQIACLAGRAEQCEAVMHATDQYSYRYRNALLPADVVRTPVGLLATHPWNRQLLASLDEQLGPEKFAAFWTSAKAPNDAMVDASGRTIGAWVHDRLRERHIALIGSPWPTASEWFVQLAFIGACVGTMVLGARRRYLSA